MMSLREVLISNKQNNTANQRDAFFNKFIFKRCHVSNFKDLSFNFEFKQKLAIKSMNGEQNIEIEKYKSFNNLLEIGFQWLSNVEILFRFHFRAVQATFDFPKYYL